MIDLGALKIGIVTGADQANKELNSVGDTATKQESKFAKFGGALKTGAMVGVGAIAGLTTAMFGMAKKSADTTDRIDKLSQKIGISRQGFQEYDYILSQNGTSVEVLQRGFKTLNDRMNESIEGTGKGAEAFDILGLSAVDLNGNLKSQEQMFEESAKALMALPEGAEKSALAFDLFGKSGQELMPLLNGTAEDMDALRQAANDMGLVLSDDAVDAGAQFQDSLDDVKRSLGSVVANIGVEVMPMFQTMLDWIVSHMPEIQAIMKVVFENIGKFINIAVDVFTKFLLPIMKSIFEWTKENWPAIQRIIEGVFKAIQSVWNNVLAPVLKLLWDIFKSIVDFVSNNFPGMQRIVESVFKGIGKAVEVVTGIFSTLVKGIQTAFDWLTRWNKEPVKDKEPRGRDRYYDGSHADGLDTVPWDGYVAELHKGERVLTADSAYKMDELLTVLYRYFSKSNESMNSKEINIGNLLNIEKNSMEDEVDAMMLAKELNRAITNTF